MNFPLIVGLSDTDSEIPLIQLNIWPPYSGSYLYSIYLFNRVATLISVGYAHIFPETTTEQILSLIFMFSGVSFYTYALGTITSILTSSDTKYEKFRSKLLALDELAQTYNMPHELYFRIKKIIK